MTTMEDATTPSDDTDFSDTENTLVIPAGNLGLHFSPTAPHVLQRIDTESPIFEHTIQFIGRIAFRLYVPDKITIRGALDNVAIESILAGSSHIADRKLMFKDRGGKPDQTLVTSTVLPKGPVYASFLETNGYIKSANRVYVERGAPNMNYEFPIGHFVQKVVIPNQFEYEGAIRTVDMLRDMLDKYKDVEGRKIVFHKELPRGGPVINVTLPKGPTGILFYADITDPSELPMISSIIAPSVLDIPVDYVVAKLIVPNEITMERMECAHFEEVLNKYSEVEGRTIVLHPSRKTISNAGTKITITLTSGKLGLIIKSFRDTFWVAKVKHDSYWIRKVPAGYYLESLAIHGEMELMGKEEMRNATYLSVKLKEHDNVADRIMVLQQNKEDITKFNNGTQRRLI
eukprot:CAMPEP_0198253836 /NCGR_PEP_ID=MMETSP1447-20131203/4219_1 /TAXON_ID=420782 /ORGANISM="Chaetoceros dichaeta, Strain CCMP1751" /LENGTH=400 /DNA_ID=CAMNT_0043939665 /DNA_START=35 /DNA_END=1237 /DNA_ORIENTATION=+